MATSTKQRVSIAVILVIMVLGTLGSFVVLIIGGQNDQRDALKQQEKTAEYQKQVKEYQAKLDAQANELSTKYYPVFSQYSTYPAPFAVDSVTTLQKTDILVGTGETVTDATEFAVYYIGWNSDGKVFDQSIKDGKLSAPLAIDGLKQASLIEGWKQGLIGMNIGGVRLLEIPSDLAYGEKTQGDDIPANASLKFIVMAIEKPEEIPTPDISALLQGLQ